MKFKFISLFLLSVCTLLSFTIYEHYQWAISKDYKIRFSGGGASGTFANLQGDIQFAPDDLARARMDVSVDVNTINTGNSLKDKHARSDDWLDAKKYPKIHFRSKRFTRTGTGYAVTGNLTMRGTTREVKIPFTFETSTTGGVFVGSLKVDREDYGIDGPWLRGAFVGDEFDIDLRVPVTQ